MLGMQHPFPAAIPACGETPSGLHSKCRGEAPAASLLGISVSPVSAVPSPGQDRMLACPSEGKGDATERTKETSPSHT